MTDYSHLERFRMRYGVLHVADRPRRHQNQHEYDQDRENGPGEFNLVAAIDLRRLTLLIISPRSETDDDVEQEDGDDQKDGAANSQRQQRDLMDRLSRR